MNGIPVYNNMGLIAWYKRKKMSKIIAALVRQVLTLAGAGGLVTGDQTEQIAGAISVIISTIWSIMEKRGKAV